MKRFERPWWHVPFMKLLNWWEVGHTSARFGEHSIPGYGPPRCHCGRVIDGHFHDEDMPKPQSP